MALSDLLQKLADQQKELEASARALRDKNSVRVQQRRAELSGTIKSTQSDINEMAAVAKADVDADVAAEKVKVSSAFDSLREKREARHAKWVANRAERKADDAEADAVDEINFAIYAIQEAEYSILDAADARIAAAEKALEA